MILIAWYPPGNGVVGWLTGVGFWTILHVFFFKMLLILRERERDRDIEHEQRRDREEDTESEAGSRLQAVSAEPTRS